VRWGGNPGLPICAAVARIGVGSAKRAVGAPDDFARDLLLPLAWRRLALNQKGFNRSAAAFSAASSAACFVTTLLLLEGCQADCESARAVEFSAFVPVRSPLSSISMLPLKPPPSSITIRRVVTLPIIEASFLISMLSPATV
jgi:hypothetical protein